MSPTQPRLWASPLAAGPTRAADPPAPPAPPPRRARRPKAPAPALLAAMIIRGSDDAILCALVPEPGHPLPAAALARIAADPAQPARTREIAAWVRAWR